MTTTNNDEEILNTLETAIKEVKRMNYTLAIKATLIRLLDEVEALSNKGVDVTELFNHIRTLHDYTLYITDTPDEVPNA